MERPIPVPTVRMPAASPLFSGGEPGCGQCHHRHHGPAVTHARDQPRQEGMRKRTGESGKEKADPHDQQRHKDGPPRPKADREKPPDNRQAEIAYEIGSSDETDLGVRKRESLFHRGQYH